MTAILVQHRATKKKIMDWNFNADFFLRTDFRKTVIL